MLLEADYFWIRRNNVKKLDNIKTMDEFDRGVLNFFIIVKVCAFLKLNPNPKP